MYAIFTDDHRNLDKLSTPLSRALERPIEWTSVFSRHTRNAVFIYQSGEVYNLFFPLQRRAYETIFVHGSVKLYETAVSLDFLARAMNGVTLGGRLILDPSLMADAAGQGRLTTAMVRDFLGDPDEMPGRFWAYEACSEALPENRSILGWYYNQRGAIVETNVTGGLIVGKPPEVAQALFGNLVYPGDKLDTFPKRLPKPVIVEIVEKVRAGELSADNPMVVSELERVSFTWNWDSHGKKFKIYQESWENYLIPGNIYKAASIMAVMRREFPDRSDLSFLEHGGNAGLLTAQLLLDMPSSLKLGVCCEIDIVPLLNGLNLYHYYVDRLANRFFVRNVPSDVLTYDRHFSVIAFVHMLLYVRRDLLSVILQRAWDALEPGGLLLTLENTHPPTSLTGVDAGALFGRDELESYLAHFGKIKYALSGTGQPASRAAGEKTPLIRYVRKEG